MKYYLTETIYIENNSMYQCITHKKTIKLTRKNWHHILSEYGWEKIPIIWTIHHASESLKNESFHTKIIVNFLIKLRIDFLKER